MTDPTTITTIDYRTIGLLQIGAQALDDLSGCRCAICTLADRDGLALHHAIVSRWNLGGWAPSQQEADTLCGVYALTLALRRACIAPKDESAAAEDQQTDVKAERIKAEIERIKAERIKAERIKAEIERIKAEEKRIKAEAEHVEDEHHDSGTADIAAWWGEHCRKTDASALHVPAVRGAATAAGLDPDAVEQWLRSSGWREQSYGRGVPRRWIETEQG